MVNDGIAEFVGRAPDRFVALGTVPMQDGHEAVAELERTTRQLGFKGVEVLTNVSGRELSASDADQAECRLRVHFRRFAALADEPGLRPIADVSLHREERRFGRPMTPSPLELATSALPRCSMRHVSALGLSANGNGPICNPRS
jgi:hypothetical protein